MNGRDLKAEYRNRTKYHPPVTDKMKSDHAKVTEILTEAACQIIDMCPESRELSLSLTKLEEARMWANAALAIHVNSKHEG